MSFRTKFLLVFFSASLALYALIGSWFSTSAQQQNDPGAQLRIFESVLQHIQHDYVDEPDLAKVRAGALRGLAYGLDPYSTYLTAEQVKSYRDEAAKVDVGIGAELSQVASYLYVIAPVKGSPAEKAGVQAGDIIEYIDTKATRDISLYDARQLLKGAAGTEVKLRILRGSPRPVIISVKRENFKTPNAEARVDAGRVGIVRINSLAEGEAADVRARVQEVVKQGAQKIVLDLRGVASGALPEAIKVANLFVKDGVIAQTVGKENKSLNTYNAAPADAIFDGPLVALIDRGTSGAAEVVASALLERKRAEVVGEKSFGAGAEQRLFVLRDGDGLLLTTVKWAAASGKPFLGAGVTPSVEVKRPELAEAIDPEDLTGNDDDPIADPNQAPDDKPESNGAAPAPSSTSPRQQPEDVQLKKALELLKDKVAAPKAA